MVGKEMRSNDQSGTFAWSLAGPRRKSHATALPCVCSQSTATVRSRSCDCLSDPFPRCSKQLLARPFFTERRCSSPFSFCPSLTPSSFKSLPINTHSQPTMTWQLSAILTGHKGDVGIPAPTPHTFSPLTRPEPSDGVACLSRMFSTLLINTHTSLFSRPRHRSRPLLLPQTT